MNLFLLALLLGADPMPSQVWPGFRGDGTSTSTAKNLPSRWSPTENLAWRTPLPGYGQSSPVVWGNRAFVTAVDGSQKEKLFVVAMDVKTGSAEWKKEFAAGQTGNNNPMMSRAAPTPVVDKTAVYAFFESGDVVAMSHAGEVKWERSLTKDYGAFKKLDPAKQKLVQMKESGGLVCVGVRDDEDGVSESGWVLVRSGVGYIDHGDHGYWTFKKKPSVVDSRLDKQQGNPAHLYQYGERFFLANDKLNGYTRIDRAKYEGTEKDQPRFLGGGGHITLAVVDDKVGYGCWIDGGGPNKGRVDVTPIGAGTKSEPAYSFHLPTGGIHGAITNSGKVFFAPSDGVCWVEADTGLMLKAYDVKINHVPLGKDGDKPRRTGAFVNHANYVVFTTGKDATAPWCC